MKKHGKKYNAAAEKIELGASTISKTPSTR